MNKMLYVADRDVELFDRAQVLSKASFSATVVQALRLYVDREEAREQKAAEIKVRIYGDGTTQTQRFYGRKITEYKFNWSPSELRSLAIYLTRKGSYALYTRTEPDWSPDNRSSGPGHDPRYEITSSLEVFDDLEALRKELPVEASERLDRAMTVDPVVDLDI